ncbi:hypothetical protein V6N12_060459 [Hibiscus sabdariffa]|uniref:Uncharacterized protein n=1 Tax=Hibiscus sabdariffa TaxID=183260 RepID=A0ABR2D4H6_9ROSI
MRYKYSYLVGHRRDRRTPRKVLILKWILVGQSQEGHLRCLGSRDDSISVVDLISSIRPPASTVKLPATASTAGQE